MENIYHLNPENTSPNTEDSNEKNSALEVLHFENYDVVLDTAMTNEEIKQEIPGILRLADKVVDKPAILPGGLKDTAYLYPDKEPKYFIKRRWYTPPPSIARDDPRPSFKGLQSVNSVINEIRIAPQVEEILETPEGIALARSYGLDRLEVIKPLAGILRTDKHKRFMVYNNVPMENLFQEDRDLGASARFFFALRELLTNSGISTYDINPEALQRSTEDSKLGYLIDLEGFSLESKDI